MLVTGWILFIIFGLISLGSWTCITLIACSGAKCELSNRGIIVVFVSTVIMAISAGIVFG